MTRGATLARLLLVLALCAAALSGCGLSDQRPSARPSDPQARSFLQQMQARTRAQYGEGVVATGVQVVYGVPYRDMGFLSAPRQYQFAVTYLRKGSSTPLVVVYPRDISPDDVISILDEFSGSDWEAFDAFSKLETSPVVFAQTVSPSDISGMPPGQAVWSFTTFDPQAGEESFRGKEVILLQLNDGTFRRMPAGSWS